MENTENKQPDSDGDSGAERVAESAPEEEAVGSSEAESPEVEEDLTSQLERARAESADNYDRYVRAVAELDNYRKRTVKMRAESREETIRDILLEIAPLLDNMRRAMSQGNGDGAAIKQGVELIFGQFQDILNGYGLVEIEAAGASFDPNLHEAMLQVESAEHPPGTVIEEMDKGYMLRKKVIRPARVVVSKAPSEVDEDDSVDQSEDSATSGGLEGNE